MRVLILGGTGMLGHKLYQTMEPPIEAWVAVRGDSPTISQLGLFCPDRCLTGVEARDEESLRRAIESVRPRAVVNCIGLIKQHPLAKDPEACIAINALLPHRLARICEEFGSRLIHIST
ncbi:MAG TPA: sugar nucleotide-binding protein, partial [Fimbriimonadaceae bacterium]|nr:sugar nucleotide-binding protein [Fimbriimonadaceae bacterium]